MQWLMTGQEGEMSAADQALRKINAYLRDNEIARIAVMEAMSSNDVGIWIRIEELVRGRARMD